LITAENKKVKSFMPSHIHFIFRSSKEQPMELLRDFKKFTSKKIIDAIDNNPIESGFVTNTIDWKYSSARNFQDDQTVLEINATGFMA
jgi:REP element-mobilizing transposase RayT